MNALGPYLLHSEVEKLTDEQLYAELASIPEQFKELVAWREKLLGIAASRESIDPVRAKDLSGWTKYSY
jgi:hypothetical protein